MKLPDPLPEPARTLRLHLDREALAANWRVLKRMSGTARAGAAIKADCYGLGVAALAPTLHAAGARDLFVAHWSEAALALEHVPADCVSVLHGPLNADDMAFARGTGVRPVINSLHQAGLWLDTGGGPCDLMVDTGMNRLGLSMSEIGSEIVAMLDVRILMSHLASADEESALNPLQLSRFREVCAAVPAQHGSLANSAGIALGSDYAFDLTRPGLALYGGVPRQEMAGAIRQVAIPQAAIIQCRTIAAGDSVGYNATFTATGPLRVGVASLGYADGFLRCWGGRGALAYEGELLPLLGRVSMDMVVVDLSSAPQLREGDWVDVPYDLQEAAAISGLSQYELLTILGRRFAR